MTDIAVRKNITLYYGPNEVLGIFRRNPKRLDRLAAALTTLGFQVELEKINDRDRLVMKLNGEKIFQCRLSFLQYEENPKMDQTLYRAIYAAVEAYSRFQHVTDLKPYCAS